MKWGRLKRIIEASGIKDEDDIDAIDYCRAFDRDDILIVSINPADRSVTIEGDVKNPIANIPVQEKGDWIEKFRKEFRNGTAIEKPTILRGQNHRKSG